MATGLPVILSDIEQHKEIFEADDSIGYLYHQNDESDYADKMQQMYHCDVTKVGKAAYDSAHENFSSARMSQKYQAAYQEIVGLRGQENA